MFSALITQSMPHAVQPVAPHRKLDAAMRWQAARHWSRDPSRSRLSAAVSFGLRDFAPGRALGRASPAISFQISTI